MIILFEGVDTNLLDQYSNLCGLLASKQQTFISVFSGVDSKDMQSPELRPDPYVKYMHTGSELPDIPLNSSNLKLYLNLSFDLVRRAADKKMVGVAPGFVEVALNQHDKIHYLFLNGIRAIGVLAKLMRDNKVKNISNSFEKQIIDSGIIKKEISQPHAMRFGTRASS